MVDTTMRIAPVTLLCRADCDRIDSAIVFLMEKVGVLVPHAGARDILRGAGARVATDDRVHIPEALLRRSLESVPPQVVLTGLDPSRRVVVGGSHVNFMAGAGLLCVLDDDGGYRRATLKDLADFTRLGDALEFLDVNHGMFDPHDVEPSAMYSMAAASIIPNTTKPTALVFDGRRDVEAIAEMAVVAVGSAEALKTRPFLTLHDSTALPPMRFETKNADALLECCRWGLPTGLVAWPMLGVSAPVTVPGAMVQTMATALTGLVLTQVANPGNPFLIQMSLGSVNMRTGNAVTAAPEVAHAHMLGAQMARYYGLPSVAIVGTDSKVSDAQAGAEKAYHLTAAALAGINLIHGTTGEMDTMMLTSAAQCVIDNDIAGMVRRLISGLGVDENTLALDATTSVSLGDGNFLTHAHTLAHFHDLFLPSCFTKESRQEWERRGARSTAQTAAQKAREILDSHFPSPLNPEQVKEICKIAESYNRSG